MTEQQTTLAPRDKPINVGDIAPPFVLPAVLDGGEEITVELAEQVKQGRVMLIFYQDDGMPICTRELQAFAQEYDLLKGAGIQVYGMNTNGIGSHAKFHERDHYPFALISDFYGEATKAFGLWDAYERKSKRAVVVIGTDGRVEYVLPHFNPGSVTTFEDVFKGLGLV
jgi:peroxiredoxin